MAAISGSSLGGAAAMAAAGPCFDVILREKIEVAYIASIRTKVDPDAVASMVRDLSTYLRAGGDSNVSITPILGSKTQMLLCRAINAIYLKCSIELRSEIEPIFDLILND